MTTFLQTEEEAQQFAISMIKNIDGKTFEQEPSEETITQFGLLHEGKMYPIDAGGDVFICETGRGWNVWIVYSGLCNRL